MKPDILVIAVFILPSIPLKNISEYLLNLGIPSIAVRNIISEIEIWNLLEGIDSEIAGAVYVSTRNLNVEFKTKSNFIPGIIPHSGNGKKPEGWLFKKLFVEVNQFDEAIAQANLIASPTYKNAVNKRGRG
ncbi:hypothetical protein Presley_29 [Acinetobacter phage Presley]|uniref:Uncharacterized protein n=1 Tax=Acinetobacter phage Presley TaxID=1406780 RepID=U5PWH4_9CAUD|nr:hypothetical protein Presley_29 [Acinetobacter phage Presley]AGY48096.1 hypothetical protein Presley_29 [Acinetobacter phage Presley]